MTTRMVILLRDGANYDYPRTEMNIGGKKIYKSEIKLREGDLFVAMSDGCPHAGIGMAYNFGWKREDIISFMENAGAGRLHGQNAVHHPHRRGATASTAKKPGDDATACVVEVRQARTDESAVRSPARPRRRATG